METLLQVFEPISLNEMDSVKLMNRIDTKFVVSREQLAYLLQSAMDNYFAQEIDGKRIAAYSSLYYDTDTMDMYLRHHNRQLVRQKIRIRTYLDSHLYFLEIKRKSNTGRTKKKRIPIATTRTPQIEQQMADFVAAKSRYRWQDLHPKLQIDFNRITLVNKQKTERLTIDSDVRWLNVVTGMEARLPRLVIIELKRTGHQPSPMRNILRNAHIQPFKISKYCIGTALTNPLLKQNRFKNKLRQLKLYEQ